MPDERTGIAIEAAAKAFHKTTREKRNRVGRSTEAALLGDKHRIFEIAKIERKVRHAEMISWQPLAESGQDQLVEHAIGQMASQKEQRARH
ncbi:hypothetical protein [Bosea sp. UNC402CLCol]|uniref:hypothetical protein n=1 Tax=Bosea sp. UNC402CLCol TaxID=1510531 RepID=UPI000AB8DC61|nr:hypothetical protein [Bosea sp. UNC402CLCol]